MPRAHGFSLVELVIVMLIVSVGILGLAGSFGNASKSLSINETVQQAAQYAQECAENAMATRHNGGFAALSGFTCGSNPAGFTRTAVVGAPYTGTSSTACPNGIQCRNIGITAASTSNAALSSSITIMLANY